MKITLRQAFATLGVAQGANEDEARAAYRKLALQYHPDKNPHAEATAKFQEISASYKKICDFHRRGGNQAAFFFDEDDDDDEGFDPGHFDDEFGFGGMDFDELEPTFEEMLMMFEMMFGPTMPSGKGKNKKHKKKKVVSKATGSSLSPQTATTDDQASKPSAESASESAPKAAVPLGKSRRRKAPLGKQRGRGGFDDPLAGFMDPEMMMFEQFMGMSMNDPDLNGMEGDLIDEMMHLFAGASDDDLLGMVGGGGGRGRRKAKAKANGKKMAAAAAREESSDEYEDVEEVSDWDDVDAKAVPSSNAMPTAASDDTTRTGNQGGDDHRGEESIAIASRVQVHGKLLGTVKFIGTVHYSKGDFVGVELDKPEGKNDGTLKGVTYFTCKPRHGVMVRPQDVARAPPSHA